MSIYLTWFTIGGFGEPKIYQNLVWFTIMWDITWSCVWLLLSESWLLLLTGVVSEENQTIIKTYKMSVPPLKDFFKPILIFMSDGELHTNKELREKVIKYFKFNESEINEKVPSGKMTRVEDRVSWTIQYLRKSLIIHTDLFSYLYP